MAVDAVRESAGAIDIVTDEQILLAQMWLARNEGIFVEPASAASVAGLFKCSGGEDTRCAPCPVRRVPEDATIVCTVTGHGLKDADTVLKYGGLGTDAPAVRAERAAIMELIARHG